MVAVYDQDATENLLARTQYEAWLLEAVYNIVGFPFIEDWPDQIVYPVSGGSSPIPKNFARMNAIIGDWRPLFLNAGAPLVFVTSFKLLDMLLEWVLERNGERSTHKFCQKIEKLKNGITFPAFIASRNWLGDRLIGLYEKLEPLRGTIIHASYFKTSDGTLHVSSSKKGSVGPEVIITAEELRGFAVLAVSLLRYIDGSWTINSYREKLLRYALDEIMHLHGLPSLGQKQPRFLTVRVFAKWSDSINIDLKQIRDDVARLNPNQDVLFDLRVVSVNDNASELIGYLFPWDEISDDHTQFIRPVSNIINFQSPLPEDIDVASILQEFKRAAWLRPRSFE